MLDESEGEGGRGVRVRGGEEQEKEEERSLCNISGARDGTTGANARRGRKERVCLRYF